MTPSFRPNSAIVRATARRLAPVVAGGLLVSVPWLIRQAATFGSPFPGQAAENLWLTASTDIFAYADRPDAATYLGRGIAALADDRIAALAHHALLFGVISAIGAGLGQASGALIAKSSLERVDTLAATGIPVLDLEDTGSVAVETIARYSAEAAAGGADVPVPVPSTSGAWVPSGLLF